MSFNYRGKHAKKDYRWLKSLLSFSIMVAAIIALSTILHTFVFQVYSVPTASMYDTIQIGDTILSEKITYLTSDPQPGDIVTFLDPQVIVGEDRTLVKRVIAVAGQTIEFYEGNVYIDGNLLDEPYTDGKLSIVEVFERSGDTYNEDGTITVNGITYPYTVPEGYIWVMGDNRTNSQDSRYFGAVPISSVTGKVICIYWPLEHFTWLNNNETNE